MKHALKSICILAAGIGAFWSGLFWHLSALAQLKALSVQATSGAAAVQRMLAASAHNNLWAAWGAMVTGVALFLLLFFKD